MENLTFKEYLDSKARLVEALKETPVQQVRYGVRKYCKIPLGESKQLREYVSLKPKQVMVVEWHYVDIDNPTPVTIKFQDPEGEDLHNCLFETFWTGEKLKKWLARNAREIFNV